MAKAEPEVKPVVTPPAVPPVAPAVPPVAPDAVKPPVVPPVAPEVKPPTQEEIDAKLKTEADAKIKAEADAKAEEARKAELPPEKYDFKLPEGVKLDENLQAKFTPIAKELGLNNVKAHKLVDLFVAHQKDQAAAAQKAWDDQAAKWHKEFTSDPQHLQVLANAKRVLSIADKETQAFFESPYFGNNPNVIRFLAKLGTLIKEDQLVDPNTSGHGTVRASAKSLYPSMTNE